ncbi:AAA family ATPase [Pseudoalteromonas sp. SCSIO 43201]|uniref:AAA family ATPase n=1 Tax=Pseudoalteromonas sp. SCSIO 43201 TaxID=2822842 RepID=UPI00207543E8|nr:ATP-binding protein [Pseudoalteromonas sp. SCSIO 43201]USD30902.1 AAA family ATPase [Pseudoalteromonas sp. SCSIO 43201]
MKKLSRNEFFQELHEVLTPSEPIKSIEFLCGREIEIDNIEEAMFAPGRHCFIYGERGVGKSSLAYTVANKIQSSDKPYLVVNCDKDSSFLSIVKQVVRRMESSVIDKSMLSTEKLGLNIAGFKYEKSNAEQAKKTYLSDSITDLSSAADVLNDISEQYSENSVVVVDEFDTIEVKEEREKFAVLIKHLSNMGAKVRFIFTGIAESLEDLLGGHSSSTRQIHQVNVFPLHWTGRFEIIDRAFTHFGVVLPEDIRMRIAGLSDGYPHYIHLICEKILAEMFRRDDGDSVVSFGVFLNSLDLAIQTIVHDEKKSYDKATLGRDEFYHHILWALADSADQIRHLEHIAFSYSEVCKKLSLEPIDNSALMKELSNLKRKPFGSIVDTGIKGRPRMYKFRESITKGLVRMIAERNNVKLDFQRLFTAGEASATAKSSYVKYQPLTPVEQKVARMRGEV